MEMTIEYPLTKETLSQPRISGPAEITHSIRLNVDVHTSEAVFGDLAEEWNDLVMRADAPLCMSLEWIQTWWRHFGRNSHRQLYIVTIRDGKDLIGLAPFYVGYSNLGKRVLSRRLQIIGSGGSRNERWGFKNDYGISDFLDIIVDPEFTKPASTLLMEVLSVLIENVDEITFHQVRDDSFIKQYLFPLLESKNWNMTYAHTDTCPYVDLSDISELGELIKGVKSNARRRQRQTLRAMDGKAPEFLITEVVGTKGLGKATNRLIELHQERWNELGFPGVFHDDRFTSFFKDLIKISDQNGWLWFKEAQDEQGVSASRMLIQFNGRYYDYISGFDPESPSAKYRPGFGLLLEVIQDALRQNTSRIELLRGEEGYKYDFTDLNFKNWEISLRKDTHKSLSQQFAHRFLQLVSTVYITIGKEKELLAVQRAKAGLLKALLGYISFRTESVRRKLKRS